MVQATATSRGVRTSAQKAGLVLDLIRGKDVAGALATLQFSTKGVAKSIHTLLKSAIANAQQAEPDLDRRRQRERAPQPVHQRH